MLVLDLKEKNDSLTVFYIVQAWLVIGWGSWTLKSFLPWGWAEDLTSSVVKSTQCVQRKY